MTNYHIEELNSTNEKDWEEFNKEVDSSSFFHTIKWKKAIENSFNLKLHYYLVYLNDDVIATCPFCENTFKGFRGLMSLPHSDYRHILFNKKDSNHLEEILSKIIEISRINKFSFVMITAMNKEIQNYLKKYNPLPYPFFRGTGNFVLNLKENPPERIWQDIFRKKTRNHIKKFEKDGFKIREATSIDDFKLFYKYYKMNLEYKDRKPIPYSFLKRLWDTYTPSVLRVTLLYKGEKVHGGMLAFVYSPLKTIYIRHLAIDRDLPGRYVVTDYVFWETVLFASNMKFNTICFGETPLDYNAPTYRNKEKFGGFFETIYSFIIPYSLTFRVGYNIYTTFNLPQQFKRIRDKYLSQ